MTDRIDHAAEAQRLVDLSSIQPDTDSARSISSAAQAHATLALVEQQRIANLIALASWNGEDDLAMEMLRAEASNTLAPWIPHSLDDEHPEIHPNIAAALGIGESK